MANGRLPSQGEMLTASIANLALRYGEDESTIAQRVYALAEQVHRHYCLNRGFVNHSESRPDEHVAVSVLTSLAGADWLLVREAERISPDLQYGQDTMTEGNPVMVSYGEETVPVKTYPFAAIVLENVDDSAEG